MDWSASSRPWCRAPPRSHEEANAESKAQLSFPGEYVRRVANDQAVVNLGYRIANASVGQNWLMVEVSMTTLPGHNLNLTRDDFWLTTPDGAKVMLASQEEFNKGSGSVRALDARANISRDSLNYLPKQASIPCRIGFFSDMSNPNRGLTYAQFSMNPDSFCGGRLYWVIPNGIKLGQHFLNIQPPDQVMTVPFKIMTKAELKDAKAKVKEWEKEQKAARKAAKRAAKEQKKYRGFAAANSRSETFIKRAAFGRPFSHLRPKGIVVRPSRPPANAPRLQRRARSLCFGGGRPVQRRPPSGWSKMPHRQSENDCGAAHCKGGIQCAETSFWFRAWFLHLPVAAATGLTKPSLHLDSTRAGSSCTRSTTPSPTSPNGSAAIL